MNGVKYRFTKEEITQVVDFSSIFAPKPLQLARFIRVFHVESPAPITIYFDPASHFLWRCMVLHNEPQWSAASLTCSPAKPSLVVSEVERAVAHLREGMKGAALTDMSSSGCAHLSKKCELALQILIGLGR